MIESKTHLVLDPLDERWVAFSASNPQANIFHHPRWYHLLAECYGYKPAVFAVCGLSGEINVAVPIMEVNSFLTGNRWVSLPFSDHCEPLYQDPEHLNQLTETLVLFSVDQNNPRIELRSKYPPHELFHTYSDHVLHALNLESSPEALFDRFHTMHKRNIKKAKKSKLHIERGTNQEHMDAFYRLHLNHRRWLGIPVQPKKFFNLLQEKLIEQGLGFVLCAYAHEECIAAYIFLHWGQTLTYKFGASDPERLALRPNNLLMWWGIRWGCENGYRILDMGRSSLSNIGLRQFKNRWGATESPLIYSTLSTVSFSSPSDKLERLMHTVIHNTPSWVCRVTGELIYKHFA